jgi:hypothetical protein
MVQIFRSISTLETLRVQLRPEEAEESYVILALMLPWHFYQEGDIVLPNLRHLFLQSYRVKDVKQVHEVLSTRYARGVQPLTSLSIVVARDMGSPKGFESLSEFVEEFKLEPGCKASEGASWE